MSESKQTYYEKLVYEALMTRELVTYDRVMAKSETPNTISDRQKNRSLSDYSDYNILKKAFSEILDLVKLMEGEGCVIVEGATRNRGFRYVGESTDPIGNVKYHIIKDVKRYWNFCQDSGGFFPEAWLDYFFKDTLNLQKLKERKRKPLVCVSLDRSLSHLEYLPSLYEAIKKKQVLHLSYAKRYEDSINVMFHPHLLKEYNGRWFVLGVDERGDYENYSLDRIHSYSVVTGIDYIPIKDAEYKYWNQIIGVSHQEWTDVVHITLKTHSLYKHGLFISKRFHESQHEILAFGNHGGEEYGMLSIDIVPNKEFYGRMLLYGDDIEVVSPSDVREQVKKRIEALRQRYST